MLVYFVFYFHYVALSIFAWQVFLYFIYTLAIFFSHYSFSHLDFPSGIIFLLLEIYLLKSPVMTATSKLCFWFSEKMSLFAIPKDVFTGFTILGWQLFPLGTPKMYSTLLGLILFLLISQLSVIFYFSTFYLVAFHIHLVIFWHSSCSLLDFSYSI